MPQTYDPRAVNAPLGNALRRTPAPEAPPTMADTHIEREVMIDAPVDVVWRTVTEPDQIGQWFAECVELELKPGGRGLLIMDGQADPIVVQVVEPPTHFSFRWNYPAGQEPAADNSMLVEFTLVSEGERTRLRVVESGHELHAWSDSDKARYAEEHRVGWGIFVERLAMLLAERPGE
jgi:uncharacterized protein YndB with AHSA1/START domain